MNIQITLQPDKNTAAGGQVDPIVMRTLSDGEIVSSGDYWKDLMGGKINQIPEDEFCKHYVYGKTVRDLGIIDPVTMYLRAVDSA